MTSIAPSCPEGYVHLVITANFWGSGKSERAALSSCRLAGGDTQLRKHGYVLLYAPPEFVISDINGSVFHPKDKPVIEVKQVKGRAR